MVNGAIHYGNSRIDYRLLFCRRKTMEIAVHPDGSVVVKAPENAAVEQIEKKLGKRARWVIKQRLYFKQFQPRTPPRCYVNGETHLYLGRQYRLRATKGKENSVRLSSGYFHVTTRSKPTPEKVKRLLDLWYLEKACIQFADSLSRCHRKFTEDPYPQLSVRKMRRRWGSLSLRGRLTLNVDLIRTPKECIDYVITHELCHFKHHNHGPRFYRLLDSIMPDWKKVKHRLELSLA